MLAPELIAHERWACIDFISDLHLHVGDPATVAAWRAYLRSSPADELLGTREIGRLVGATCHLDAPDADSLLHLTKG